MEYATHNMQCMTSNDHNLRSKLWSCSTLETQRGFTLIEMMVAVSIFIVVMTVAAGSLIATLNANKKAQAKQELMSGVDFAIADITRNMRVGSLYHCGPGNDFQHGKDCTSGTRLAFEAAGGEPANRNDQWVYWLDGTTLMKSITGGTNAIKLTPPNIKIKTFQVQVKGANSSSDEQASAVILLQGTAGDKDNIQTDFDIQTTVTQRVLSDLSGHKTEEI
jgi:prepilin-type N-terminal cleavage/methylation domain-containing protein